MNEKKLKKIIGNRIRLFRNKLSLTQEELGERSGVSWKFIGEIERGNANPSLEVLSKISEALGITLSELFDIEDRYPAKEVLQRAQKLKVELVEYLEGLNNNKQTKALKVLKAIFDENTLKNNQDAH